MYLDTFSIETDNGWGMDNIQLNPNLNLLVGGSGVGKTQILNGILTLSHLAIHSGFSPFMPIFAGSNLKWKAIFKSESNDTYLWEGECKCLENNDYFHFIHEKYTLNGIAHIERHLDKIFFSEKEFPSTNIKLSLFSIFSKLPIPVFLNKILHRDQTLQGGRHNSFYLGHDMDSLNTLIEKYKLEIDNIESLLNKEEITHPNFRLKLWLVIKLFPKIWKTKIVDKFIEIFPQIEDISLKPVTEYRNSPKIDILFKLKNRPQWLPPDFISSGMFRTFELLCDLHFSPKWTLILIDEFENSLGTNCMDILAEELVEASFRGLQIVATSHHPYIINNIPYEHWKIVNRRTDGMVVVKNAADYQLGRSKQAAFLQLSKLLEHPENL